MKGKLTQAELKNQLHYNKNTGIFTWKIKKGNIKIGDIAGRNFNGYIRIGINNEQYFAHQLAWLYVKGYFPEHEIDHKFGIKNDNRWTKLHHVTRICNM